MPIEGRPHRKRLKGESKQSLGVKKIRRRSLRARLHLDSGRLELLGQYTALYNLECSIIMYSKYVSHTTRRDRMTENRDERRESKSVTACALRHLKRARKLHQSLSEASPWDWGQTPSQIEYQLRPRRNLEHHGQCVVLETEEGPSGTTGHVGYGPTAQL